MQRLAVAVLCLTCVTDAGASEASVVLGSARSIKHVDVEIPCPAGYLCMDGWYRYNLSIEGVIAGPAVPSRIRAAIMQHTDLATEYRNSLRAFVLRPIEKAEDRAALEADYYLVSFSPAHELYCLAGAPEELGIDPGAVKFSENGKFCFSAEEAK